MLDGFICDDAAEKNMALIVHKGAKQVAVMTYPSLITESSVRKSAGTKDACLVDDAHLRIDAPGVHAAIKSYLQ